MFGLDDFLASYSDGAGLVVVALVALLLGLRHATDPDHLAAVTALAPSEPGPRRAARLGLAWGAGHALTLFAFGLPVVLFDAFLPERVQQGAETAVGVMIVALAVWLLLRWLRGDFRLHAHPEAHGARTPFQAFGVGLLHGVGGSAGVGILLVATIDSRVYAVVALVVLALFTAVSMTVLTTAFGAAFARVRLARVVPLLGATGLAFGIWYALGALSLAPYYF
jgi:High-affinity nickel-transport protein